MREEEEQRLKALEILWDEQEKYWKNSIILNILAENMDKLDKSQ